MRVALVGHGLPYRVEATADLAILQFAKFRLWKDLDEHWADFAENPLVGHLVHEPTEAFEDPARDTGGFADLDELGASCPPPADAWQLRAIARPTAGRTFVLEGPPGTGKSQTIPTCSPARSPTGKGCCSSRRSGPPRRGRTAAGRRGHGHVRPRPARQGLAGLDGAGADPAGARARGRRRRAGPGRRRGDLRSARRCSPATPTGCTTTTPPGLSLYSARTAELTAGTDVEPLPVPSRSSPTPRPRCSARCAARWRCCPRSPT